MRHPRPWRTYDECVDYVDFKAFAERTWAQAFWAWVKVCP